MVHMSQHNRRIWVQALGGDRLERAQAAFATRRVPRTAMQTLVGGTVRPRSGDLVLASVSRLGQHQWIARPDGRRAALHLHDEIIVAYADRYATDQFESHVPDNLGPTQLVASGGIAARMITRSRDVRAATDILPLGLIGDDRGRPLNVADFALEPEPPADQRPRTICVLGTSMNSGKTTTVHALVHGLDRAGARPGAAKATGTGAGGDYWVMLDAGAHRMLDFTDVGLASTYRRAMPVIERTFSELVNHLTVSGCGVNLIEVADGIYQRETAALIESPVFRDMVDAIVFASADAMGAAAGVAHLRSLDLPIVAVAGRITRSPLATREAEAVTGLPVLTLPQLGDPTAICGLLGLDPSLLNAPLDAPPPAWPITVPGLGDSTLAPNVARDVGEWPAEDEFVFSDEVTVVQLSDQR
jgi:hypothetical protein